MRSFVFLTLASLFALTSACTDAPPSAPATEKASAAMTSSPTGTCEHGVSRDICARCQPTLKPAFVAKNDWCAEHERPESQCVLCHPDLAKAGVK